MGRHGHSRAQNRLLEGVPQPQYQRLVPHLETKSVAPGQVLHRAGQPVHRVYFPSGGVFSVTRTLPDGTMVEAAIVGREGILGIEACFGADVPALGDALLQIADGQLTSLPTDVFRRELVTAEALQGVVWRYLHAFLGTVMQCAACNALHGVQRRCARWLLMAHDRMPGGQFRLSHEMLAAVLGVTRPTVTLAASKLQEAGLITYVHGQVRILDRRRLEAVTCVCYFLIRRLFEPTWPSRSKA